MEKKSRELFPLYNLSSLDRHISALPHSGLHASFWPPPKLQQRQCKHYAAPTNHRRPYKFFFYRNRGHLTLMRYFSATLLPFNSFSLSEVSGIKPGPTITKQAARQIYFYYKDDVLTFLEFFFVLSLLKLS